MKGRRQFISWLVVLVMTLACLPQTVLAATYNIQLDAVPVGGKVMYGETELSTTALPGIEAGEVIFKFVPDRGYKVEKVEIGKKIRNQIKYTDYTGSVNNNELTWTLAENIFLRVSFKGDGSGGNGKIAANGEKVYNVPETVRAGKSADVSFSFTLPSITTQGETFLVNAEIKGETEEDLKLFGFCKEYIKTPDGLDMYRASDNGVMYMTHFEKTAGNEVNVKITINLEEKTYAVSFRGSMSNNAYVASKTYDLPHTYTDYTQAEITKVSVVGNSVSNDSTTISGLTVALQLDAIDIVNDRIDAITISPEELTFANYSPIETEIDEIEALIRANGLDITEDRQDKLDNLKNAISVLLENPVNEIQYLIEYILPDDSGNINSSLDEATFKQYADATARITELLDSDPSIAESLDSALLTKYEETKQVVEKVTKEKRLEELLAGLPDTVTTENLTETKEAVKEIKTLLDELGYEENNYPVKYTDAIAAIAEISSQFDRYQPIDFSSSFNGIVFADTSDIPALQARPDFTSPNFIGNGNLTPSRILSKVSFDAMKSGGKIYSNNLGIPFEINTDAGLVIGGAQASGATNITMEIPITPGIYEEISVVLYSHYEYDDGKSFMTVNFTEGDPVTAIWRTPEPRDDAGFSHEYITDTVKIVPESGHPVAVEDSDNKGTTYIVKNNGTRYLPVFTMKNLQAGGTRIIKSITFSGWDSIGVGVLGITGKMPAHDVLGEKLEGLISGLGTDAESIVNSIETVEAVKNMLDEYREVTDAVTGENADIAEDKSEKFDTIFTEYNTKAVQLTEKSDFTDYETSEAVFEFKNPINTENLASFVTVTADGKTVSNPNVEVINNKSFKVVFENDLNYSKQYAITVKSTLPDANKSGFTLRHDMTYTYHPEPPMEVIEAALAGALTEIPASGDFDVSLNIVKNTETDKAGVDKCAVSVCLYNADGELVQSKMIQVLPNVGEGITQTVTLTSPGEGASIKCFVLDGFGTMNKIWKTVEIN